MRATKLVLAFLLSLALAAPPGLVAQSRGKGPDKGRGHGPGKAKVERPEKPQPMKRQNLGRSAERPQRARPAPRPQPDRVVRDVRDGNLRFRGMDTNGDRRISRSEWRGNDVSFGNHDWNGDGILSGPEVVPGGRADRVTRYVTRDRVRIRDRDRRGDLRFYSDRLGHRIALAPAPLLTRIDRQFDLTWDVTRRFDAEPVRRRSPRPDLVRLDFGIDLDLPVRDLEFDAIDYDRDGEIARVEWVGDPYRVHRLDRNDNGVVGRWEYALGWLRGV